MLDKKILLSKHVKERFLQRNLKLDKRYKSIEAQLKNDLRPLNIKKQYKIDDNIYKIITNQNLTYIIKVLDSKYAIVKTIYKAKRSERLRF